MTASHETVPQRKQIRSIPSTVLSDGSIVEMVHDPVRHQTRLGVYRNGTFQTETSVTENGTKLVPYAPENNLLIHEVVLFPSEPIEYGSQEDLVSEIRDFIHAHVDVSPLFEMIATYYILFSWVYDSFNELPYLRVRGDTGSGKTRCLLTIGSLCYKPIFASGASTVSPIFRILDSFEGTLIVDEGDFRFSDEKAEIIKILNNGNARGFPVLRSEAVNGGKEFDPKAYRVFGPKIIATRYHFDDRALETRCITEETGSRKLRNDVPLNLPADWKERARTLRNKLLMYRFRNYGKFVLDEADMDRSIEPRLAQLFSPLLSIIPEPSTKAALLEMAREYDRDLVLDRAADVEGHVLEALREALAESPSGQPSMKDVTRVFAARFGDEYDRRITAKWIGSIVRRNLQLKTQKSNGVFVLAPTEKPKMQRLFERYGLVDRSDSGGASLGDIETSGSL